MRKMSGYWGFVSATLLTTMLSLPMSAFPRSAAAAGPNPYPGAKGQPFQALQGQITDVQSQIGTIERDVADIKARIVALQADVAVLQSQIAQNTGNVSALQSQVISNTSSIGALQAVATSLEGQIASLQQTKQNAVVGSCVGGSAIRTILPSGSVVCEFDAGESRMAVFGTEFTILDGETKFGTAFCPTGWFATGGGHATSRSASSVLVVVQSEPAGTTGWTVGVVNFVGSATATARATVMCASN